MKSTNGMLPIFCNVCLILNDSIIHIVVHCMLFLSFQIYRPRPKSASSRSSSSRSRSRSRSRYSDSSRSRSRSRSSSNSSRSSSSSSSSAGSADSEHLYRDLGSPSKTSRGQPPLHRKRCKWKWSFFNGQTILFL